MTAIKPPDSSGAIKLTELAETAPARKSGVEKPAQEEALQFDREAGGLFQLYREAAAQVETEQAAKVQELKRLVAEGAYRPNLETVAQRLLER